MQDNNDNGDLMVMIHKNDVHGDDDNDKMVMIMMMIEVDFEGGGGDDMVRDIIPGSQFLSKWHSLLYLDLFL